MEKSWLSPWRPTSLSQTCLNEHVLSPQVVCNSHVKLKLPSVVCYPLHLLQTNTHTHPSCDDCFDLCSEEIRPFVLDVTGWHITWIQANKRAEGKNIKGTFQAFTESFQNGTMTLPSGEKVIMLVCLY